MQSLRPWLGVGAGMVAAWLWLHGAARPPARVLPEVVLVLGAVLLGRLLLSVFEAFAEGEPAGR